MIRYIWKYRYSRCKVPRIRNFHQSITVSMEKLDQNSILFNDNTSIKQPSITGKISTYLKDFIKQESRHIADALTKDDSNSSYLYYDEDRTYLSHYMNLEDDIIRQLEQPIDTYNKFCLLLTFNPISIHPIIYLGMYEKLNVPLEFDMKRLLAKRLTFHNLFDECWKILLDNDTTLNDIEEYVDIIVEELKRQNNFELGIFEFLRSANNFISNQSIKSTIIDTILYNYNISKIDTKQYISLSKEVENIQELEDLTSFFETQSQSYSGSMKILSQVIYMRKKVNIITNMASEDNLLTNWEPFFSEIVTFKDLIKTPGWLTAVMPRIATFSYLSNSFNLTRNDGYNNNERISYFVVKSIKSNNKFIMNDYDILHILKDMKISENVTIFQFFKKLHKHHLNTTNTHINNHFFHLALINDDTQTLFEILAYCQNNIPISKIGKSLYMIFEDSKSKFKHLVKKLNKRNSEEKNLKIFDEFLVEYFKNHNQKISIDFLVLAQSFNKTKIMRPIMRKLLCGINSENMSQELASSLFHNLVSEFQNSTSVLLEISRCAIVRNRLIEPDLISLLFGTILKRTMISLDQTLVLPYSFEMKINDDFQKIYALASYEEKSRLHNTVRAFAQSLSNLNEDSIVKVLNTLHNVIFKAEFEYIKSETGKRYIFNSLVFDVMRFVNRSQSKSGSNSILKMRNIIKGINFESEIAQGFLYKNMVSQNTKQAINIFNYHMKRDGHVTKSILRYIISGIFSSGHHTGKEKVALFYDFKSELSKTGYKLNLQTVNAIELMNIIVEITKDSPNKSIQSIQTILDYANQNKIPKPVMRYWAKKLK